MGGTQALATAAAEFPQFAQYPITSVKRESNKDGSPIGAGHLTGNAVDVAVPDSQAGFNYVVAAARSGRFAEIGTNPKWIPVLKQYFPDVEFFPDYKQVHAHLEVSP